MNKKIYLFSLVLLALVFVSCEETKEEGKYDNWRARNESYIDDLRNTYDSAPDHGGLSRIQPLQTNPNDCIYYKVVKTAPAGNTESPKYTDWVKVYYKGTNILGEYFDGNFTGENPIIDGSDAGMGDSPTTTFQVNGVISGWGEVLQKMKKGDRWVVYIPWQYGYGSGGNSSILGYSTLIFDITLLDFANNKEDL